LHTNKIAYYNRALVQKHELDPGELCNPLEDYTLQIKPNNRDIYVWDTEALWPSGYYFGDGSGDRYSKYPSLTRCGVGIHYVDTHKFPTYDMSTPLPGEIHTNNRAELYALLLVVQNLELAGKVDFFTDNKIIKDTYNKGKYRAIIANHADLLAEVFLHIEENYRDISVYWMPTHTDKHPEKKEKAPAWMQDWHVKGNNEADTLAGAAAALHEIPRRVAQPITQICTNLALIQDRLIQVTKFSHKETITKQYIST